MSIYQRDDDPAPDAVYDPGTLEHLVVGNHGRMLDPRRTPVSIVDVRPATGFVVLRIDAFEDAGAEWEIPFEDIGHYQFEIAAKRASPDDLVTFRDAVDRFDRPLTVICGAHTREETGRRVASAIADAARWLRTRSSFVREGGVAPDPATRRGDPRLAKDLAAYMDGRGLADMEATFARQFVSGPHAGEIVKGHRIVLAEIGLVPYAGKVVRDPDTFAGGWRRERRAEHVVARLGFVGALLAHLRRDPLVIYRGLSTQEVLVPPPNHTFVSTTLARRVAESHFDAGGPHATALLMRQTVAARRVFMTYLETAAMNEQFLEAEAVLLWEEGNLAF